jgi:hypothetical protein
VQLDSDGAVLPSLPTHETARDSVDSKAPQSAGQTVKSGTCQLYVTAPGAAISANSSGSARAGSRHFSPLSALRAHTKAPYKMDFHKKKQKTLRALNCPKAAQTVC